MRFVLPDDRIVSGRSYSDIIRAMAQEKFTAPRSIARYRKALARRVRALYKTDVDDTTDRSLVQSLIRCGLLTPTK